MSKQLKKGYVKRVLSGDTIVVLGPVGENGYPMEKRITLYGVAAPWKGNETTPEDPFFWESKEYLRNKVAGKEVEFNSFKQSDKPGEKPTEMVLAHVYLDGEDVALDILNKGFAYVSKKRQETDPAKQPKDWEKYIKASQDAKNDKIGMNGKLADRELVIVKKKEDHATLFKD